MKLMIQKRKRRVWTAVGMMTALGLVMGASGPSLGEQTRSQIHEPGSYEVVDGKVDDATFRGYQVYTRACMACHGPDGVGSSFAPSLVRMAERRTFAEFAGTVAAGQEVQPGQVMPSFADDPYVMQHVGHIYSYLKARGEGGLGRGRPRVIEDEE